MLIYGNTPADIRKMMWRKRYRLLSIVAVILVAIMLTGCGTVKDKKIELKALDRFWDALAGGKTKDLADKAD